VPLRLLLVDPQPLFCEALASTLTGDDRVEVVGWTTTEREAAHLATAASPEVVLTELDLAPGSGLGLARRLRDVRVVILTRRDEGEVLLEVVDAGAAGCLGHSLSPGDLPRLLVDSPPAGFVHDPRRLLRTLRIAAARPAAAAAPPELASLTPRERDVLNLIARGLDTRGIAEALYLSPETARTHVRNILRKLGVHSRVEAARLALRSGLSPPEGGVLRMLGPDLESR
jgi:DNA-binding NarL/FixJ family response regulator